MSEVPNTRTFSLNSEEFYRAVTPPPDPWVWGPGLPREPLWGRQSEPVAVWAEDDADAQAVLADWRRHVQTGTAA